MTPLIEFQPKNLTCTACGALFVFSIGEQEFFAQRNLVNQPKRCLNCRLVLRLTRTGRDTSTLTEVACDQCEQITKVPFKPHGHRPIYCNECLAERRASAHDQPSQNNDVSDASDNQRMANDNEFDQAIHHRM